MPCQRWKRCSAAVAGTFGDDQLGEIVGQIFVREHFGATGLGTHTRKIKEKPDEVRRVIKATIRANRFIRDNRDEAVRTPVKLGRSSVNTIEIINGLEPGDQVGRQPQRRLQRQHWRQRPARPHRGSRPRFVSVSRAVSRGEPAVLRSGLWYVDGFGNCAEVGVESFLGRFVVVRRDGQYAVNAEIAPSSEPERAVTTVCPPQEAGWFHAEPRPRGPEGDTWFARRRTGRCED